MTGLLADQIDGQATSCYLVGAPRLNPHFSSFISVPAGGDSYYSVLQVLLTKRLAKGLRLQSSYTWSKLIDDSQGIGGQEFSGPNSNVGIDPLHDKTDRGPSGFDLTNNWCVNAIYHFPDFASSKGFMSKIANGWWTSGIYSLRSGYPLTVFLSANRSQTQEEIGQSNPVERPDVVPGRINSNIVHGVSASCGTGATRAAGGTAIAAGTPLGTPTLYYDPCAFST
jgi:hypothetical protein